MVSPFLDTKHKAHTITLALNIHAAVLPQPHSPFLVGWGPDVNNVAQLPTSFIPAAGLYLREKKDISYLFPSITNKMQRYTIYLLL